MEKNPQKTKTKAFPLTCGTRQGCPLAPLLLNTVLKILTRAIRQEKYIKGIQIHRKEVQLSLFPDDTLLELENPKNSTEKLLELKNSVNAGYIIKIQKSAAFYMPIFKNLKKKFKM